MSDNGFSEDEARARHSDSEVESLRNTVEEDVTIDGDDDDDLFGDGGADEDVASP